MEAWMAEYRRFNIDSNDYNFLGTDILMVYNIVGRKIKKKIKPSKYVCCKKEEKSQQIK